MKRQLSLIVFSFILLCAQVHARDTRFELQAGASFGDTEIDAIGFSQDLDTDTGLIFGAGFWWDAKPAISLGLQYNYITGVDFEESGNFLGTSASVSLENDIHLFMVNAVIRDNTGRAMGPFRFHPYVGGGIGGAYVDSEITASVVISGTTISGSDQDDDFVVAGQAMGGFDMDITDRAYIGFNGSYLVNINDADLFGARVSFDGFRAMGIFGYKF